MRRSPSQRAGAQVKQHRSPDALPALALHEELAAIAAGALELPGGRVTIRHSADDEAGMIVDVLPKAAPALTDHPEAGDPAWWHEPEWDRCS